MKTKFLLIAGLMVLFFFGEIAISFSDRAAKNSVTGNANISFALNLENSDTDFEQAAYIDRLFESFLEKYNIKGASVAVTQGEKLVYAKGFGYANEETTEKVQPGHLFRIASVSKLITATAIMELVDDGMLNLEDHVFGKEGILNDEIFSKYRDPRIGDIKVKHLLNHSAGWSRKKGDPMFNFQVISRRTKEIQGDALDKIIAYELGKKLYFDPGTQYSYSNLGYAILGKIIERKSGIPYEDFVVMNILKPMGINDMHIGKNLYYEKFPNEVRYYEPPGSSLCLSADGSGKMVPKSYGGNDVTLLGAAGGWIASAPELARFLCAVDGFNSIPDLLDSVTVFSMTDHQVAGKGLYGWRGTDSYGTWWRTGSLSGTTALIMRMENGLNWVVLLNTSSYKRTRIHNKLSRTIFAASYRVKNWPDYDLFAIGADDQLSPIERIPVNNPEL